MMELTNIFNATPNSTWQVLCDSGVGFYIPPYQRGYNWDSTHIDRLFEDLGHGLRLLVNDTDKNSITFLGTLIVIDKNQLPGINQEHLPSKIRLIIDGQQRLTTVLLMNICLHDEIRRRRIGFRDKDEKAFKWLDRKAIEVERDLEKTFEEDMNWGENSIDGIQELYRRYPRMIRAYDDFWSRLQNEARYRSPIAAFVHGYSKHIHGDDQTQIGYVGQSGGTDEDEHLLNNYKVIQKNLQAMADKNNTDMEMPSLVDIAGNSEFQSTILRAEFPKETRAILSNEGCEDFKQLTLLVLLARFLMSRVQVVVVSASNEDYGFDMFESLNTTGEPLTAFETFKPRVIEIETLANYENSPSREFLRPIENYSGKFKKAEDRHRETSRFLIPFALAETGTKLSKRHSHQRKYLRDQYDRQLQPEEKHKFLEHMAHTVTFIEDTWKQENRAFKSMKFPDPDIVLTCMDMLGTVHHEIAIGSLVRFYSQVQLVPQDRKQAAERELENAIKAVTAFFAFWRGSGKTTGSLATQYRELMERGFEELGNQAFCRCPENGASLTSLTADKLQEALRYILKNRGEINSKADWVRLSCEQPVYKDRKTLTRFLLFAAMHNTSEDENYKGLRVQGRPGVLDMLIWRKWSQDLQIEHIAPQNPEQRTWNESLYEQPSLLDCLGNLTLLPKAENSSFNNRPWKEKKEMYRILAVPRPNELETHLEQLQDQGIQLSDSTKNLLCQGNYLQHLSALCNVGNWTPKFVQERSRRLTELVWQNIAPWLGFDINIE